MAIIYPSSKARKERIYKLLDEAVEPAVILDDGAGNTQSVDDTALSLPWFRSGVLAAALGFLLLASFSFMPVHFALMLGALFAAAFLHSLSLLVQQKSRLKKAAARLRPRLDTLCAARDGLNAYLVELDNRTRKYFHCVTNTKVTTYCILKQMLLSLDDRISAVDPLLKRPSAQSLQAAQDELAKDIVFREGFLKNSGKERAVAPERIAGIIAGLRDELERSLEELEEEILRDPATAAGQRATQASASRQ